MTKQRIVALVLVLILGLGGIFVATQGPETIKEKDFDAYGLPDEVDLNGAAKTPADGEASTNNKVTKKMVRQPDDVLNRTGPEGMADDGTPTGRTIKNKRPRSDEDTGKQGGGTLDKDEIRAGIDAIKPLVKECYEASLEDFPDAAGKITVGFTIIGENGKGRVEMSELAENGTTLHDQKLHDCMLKRIGDAEFKVPSGDGVVSVRYPFEFSNDADDE